MVIGYLFGVWQSDFNIASEIKHVAPLSMIQILQLTSMLPGNIWFRERQWLIDSLGWLNIKCTFY